VEPAAIGRLTSRPSPDAAPALPPGVTPLAGDSLVAVPDGRPRPRPLLVFFHGAGGQALSSLPVLQEPLGARGVIALLPTSAGSTWDLLAGGLGRDVATLDAQLAEVFARHPVDRVALGGFSDGASYALSLGLANGDLAPSVLAFSPGFLAPPRLVGTPRCWVSHGTQDRVLPVDRCGRRVVRSLREAGHEVTYEEFAGGHVITPQLVGAALDWWLANGERRES
jgi:phospholipase/carboxylesterase